MKKTIIFVLVFVLGMATEIVNADFTFGTPIQLDQNVNSESHEFRPSISGDGLSLYFSSNRHSASLDFDIYVSTRTSQDEPWGQAVPIGPPVNTSASENAPCISADGLTLLFSENPGGAFTPPRHPNGYGEDDIWVTTRATLYAAWSEPMNLGPVVNTEYNEGFPELSSDGLSLFFASNRPGSYGGPHDAAGLWVTTRPTKDGKWGEPVNLGSVVSTGGAGMPSISVDSLHLFFASNRPPSTATHMVDLYLTSRRSITEDWDPPIRLGPPINTLQSWECYPCISPNASELYFIADNWTGTFSYYDIWCAPIIPIIDLNGDGIVDTADMCIIVENWGTDEPLCDIGPTPLGDGVVDVQDLIVLAEYLFDDINDPTLVAHWAFDEKEGHIASDSANDNDGNIHGEPAWQPDGGMVAGSLQFDGIDDYVSTPYIISPTDGNFSILAWIKGGSAGQVILSQESGVNWLMADDVDGALRTDLKVPGTSGREANPAGPPLTCSTVVTDSNWHRVGFVRDDSNRILYVDDIEVAHDTAENLGPSSGVLYIGTGPTMESGTYWSGLIDDVRIYDRAVTP